jgi:hypothetical protein
MATGAWIIVGLAALWTVVFPFLYRNHQAWLERQSPLGAWIASISGRKITLIFEGGPHEGLYKQLTEENGQRIREFGHWCQHKNKLEMLIMASDIPSNPRFGRNAIYKILFLRARKIAIIGPDRPNISYIKAPEGTILDFGEPPAPHSATAPKPNSNPSS